MDSQNHYYGHSAAFAAYLGMGRPRHIAGLVQHGWTSASPVRTHFRDFTRGPLAVPPLIVWSHESRSWDPRDEAHPSVPIGAPWLYLAAAAPLPEPGEGTVIFPVHGLLTQTMHGDHHAMAREWLDAVGPATVCLYHVEAAQPEIVAAYRGAGHRCVTLGHRNDPRFLFRLRRLVAGARRVVSNRLSTPVVYAAAAGRDAFVTGAAMRLDGEDGSEPLRIKELWPEFYDGAGSVIERADIARAELGAAFVRPPDELRRVLGWDGYPSVGPWVHHWVLSPAVRFVAQMRLKATEPRAARPTNGSVSTRQWLRGAIDYLPQRLGRVPSWDAAEPIVVD